MKDAPQSQISRAENPRLFVMAGEASGDALGALLMQQLNGFDIFGVGGAGMKAQGLQSILPMEDFGIIGFHAIPGAILRLNRHADTLIDAIMSRRPQVIVTIDNKGFALRFARRLKKRMESAGWHAPIVHIVAPTVWGWGRWRVRDVARSVDHLLCLFPFEDSYFTGCGIDVTVVGHPAAEITRPTRKAARQALGIADDTPLLALLPGSRKREITQLLPDMLAAFDILRGENDALRNLEAVIPVAGGMENHVADIITAHDHGNHPHRVEQEKMQDVLAAADYGMICSGTATLEAALSGLCGAVYYRPDFLTRIIARLIADTDKAVLANAVAGHEIYPAYMMRPFTPRIMAHRARPYLTGESAKGRRIHAREIAKSLMVKGGFARTAARVIIAAANAKRP